MLAIDLGGTRVKAGLVVDGEVTGLVAVEHGGSSLDEALRCVASLVTQLVPDGCGQVGLCLPGVVGDDGRVLALPGKLEGVVGVDLPAWLERRTGGRALVVNDARAYAVGEAWDEPGRTLVVTLGTGVGTAVVEDGRPVGKGPLGGGALAGQVPLTADGPTDSAGRQGTVEAWCRASRILVHVTEAGCTATDVPSALQAAAAGEPAAVAGLAAYRQWLARGLAAMCLAHAPDTVVVGGGPVRPDGVLLDGLQELLDPLLWPGQDVTVRPARYGDSAALVGLSVLAGSR